MRWFNDAPLPPLARLAAVLLFASSLLLGFAHLLILPPWEGFDEPAHYSYVSQLAETGRWPLRGDPMSREVDETLDVAPATRSMPSRWSYSAFFAAAPDVIARGRGAIQDVKNTPLWAPGRHFNWQAQHPPLYYALLSPVYSVAQTWSLQDRLLLMRGVSYLTAWLALVVAAIWISRCFASQEAPFVVLAVAGWPILFPMWLPEMARIGNDSMIALIAACAFPVAYRATAAPNVRVGAYGLLGLLLGLGLLTKATFLPFVIATLFLLTAKALVDRTEATLMRRLSGVMVLILVMLAVCGWWYGLKFVETGNLIGSNDTANLDRSGGLIAGLSEHAKIETFVRLPWLMSSGFFWSGTWSFALPPRMSLMALVVVSIPIAIGYLLSARPRSITLANCIAPLTLILFAGALVHHSLVLIALGLPGAPTWYMHSFAPVFAPLVAFGILGLRTWRIWKPAVVAFAAVPLAFIPLVFGIHTLFFAGCGTHRPGLTYYDLGSAATCGANLGAIRQNLSLFGWPDLAGVLFVVGWLLGLFGLVAMLRFLFAFRHEAPQPSITSTR